MYRVAAAVFLMIPAAATAGEPLTVHLVSGRNYTAPVDARTDHQRLWLRFEGRGAQLLRPVAWGSIVAAEFRGKPVEIGELTTLAARIKGRSSLESLRSRPPRGAASHAEAARAILFAPAARP